MKRTLLAALTAIMLAGGAAAADKNPVVILDTSMGPIKVELFADKAPGTVKNFLSYVDDKHYDGTIFHRVIPNFMVQGGGMEPGLKEKKTKDPIKNESDNGLENVRGTLAMARVGRDVRGVKAADSATSQFFINVKDNDFLNRAKAQDRVGYCVFGRVIEGMDVVDKIRAVETAPRGDSDDVPIKDVVLKSAKRAQ